MRKMVRIAAGVIGAAVIATAAVSCDEDDDPTGPGVATFTAALLGANERPNPVTTSATGTATFVDRTTSIDYTIDVSGITAPFAAHIHLGGPAVAGGIIINLFVPTGPIPGSVSGNLVSGTITSRSSPTVSLDSLRVLFNNGNSYVNVHTSANTPGEIRGQVALSN